jgi:hypothetical protein
MVPRTLAESGAGGAGEPGAFAESNMENGPRAASNVGEDLLDGGVAVLLLGLDLFERESVKTARYCHRRNSSFWRAGAGGLGRGPGNDQLGDDSLALLRCERCSEHFGDLRATDSGAQPVIRDRLEPGSRHEIGPSNDARSRQASNNRAQEVFCRTGNGSFRSSVVPAQRASSPSTRPESAQLTRWIEAKRRSRRQLSRGW